LHQVLREHLATFLARTSEQHGPGLPRFVTREFERTLTCGILAHGFARLRCTQCGQDELVAFSCKGRGFCPSCAGRRMADTAAHLVDAVLPAVRVRQWVLSFPYHIRFLLAFDPALCSPVRGIFVRTILGWLRQRAEAAGAPGGSSGAVVLAQRFGGALNLNLHFHALVLDGVYTSKSPLAPPRFQPAVELTDQDVVHVTRLLVRRVVRYLQRRGRLPRQEQAGHDEPEPDEPLLAQLSAASVAGRIALVPKSGQPLTRRGRQRDRRPQFIPGERCCDLEGFSLHAKVRIEGHDRPGLERLCRYIARPAIASERLSIDPDGRVIYRLRRPWSDGTSAIVSEPLAFLERLAALVPRPRAHLLTYHGVLAPASAWRDLVVPKRAPASTSPSCGPLAPNSPTAPSTSARSRSSRSTWAEFLRRDFALDVLTCP
jgi:hypothetical protein